MECVYLACIPLFFLLPLSRCGERVAKPRRHTFLEPLPLAFSCPSPLTLTFNSTSDSCESELRNDAVVEKSEVELNVNAKDDENENAMGERLQKGVSSCIGDSSTTSWKWQNKIGGYRQDICIPLRTWLIQGKRKKQEKKRKVCLISFLFFCHLITTRLFLSGFIFLVIVLFLSILHSSLRLFWTLYFTTSIQTCRLISVVEQIHVSFFLFLHRGLYYL